MVMIEREGAARIYILVIWSVLNPSQRLSDPYFIFFGLLRTLNPTVRFKVESESSKSSESTVKAVFIFIDII